MTTSSNCVVQLLVREQSKTTETNFVNVHNVKEMVQLKLVKRATRSKRIEQTGIQKICRKK